MYSNSLPASDGLLRIEIIESDTGRPGGIRQTIEMNLASINIYAILPALVVSVFGIAIMVAEPFVSESREVHTWLACTGGNGGGNAFAVSDGRTARPVVFEPVDRRRLRCLSEFCFSTHCRDHDPHLGRLPAPRTHEPSGVLFAAVVRHGGHDHDGRLERTGDGVPRARNPFDCDIRHGRVSTNRSASRTNRH